MKTVQHKFVEFIPDQIANDTLYISMPFATVVHKCLCGCGEEVVTPLSPADWKLSFDGQTISLSPSIGNWEFKCRSHYWIINNTVKHSNQWTDEEVEKNRKKDGKAKRIFFAKKKSYKGKLWKLLPFQMGKK